jgi:lipoprotein-anchoring transpeptidase ErfK/SrfK
MMPSNQPTAREAIRYAQEALHRGDKRAVRHWAELAIAQDATREEPWLFLAAVSTPRASVMFLGRALQVNPGSERAKKGMEWALKRLRETEAAKRPAAEITQPVRAESPTRPVRVEKDPAPTQPVRTARLARKKTANFPVLLSLLACFFIAALVFISARPAAAFINSLAESQRGAVNWAVAQVEKSTDVPFPTLTPLPSATFTPEASATQPVDPTSTQLPESTSTLAATSTKPVGQAVSPTPLSTDVTYEPTPTPLPTDTPAPTREAPAASYTGGKLILVDISEQHLYAYENGALVYSFVASTGMNGGTRVGTFSVLDKIPSAYGSTWNIWMPNWLGIYWSGSLENGIHALPILPNGQRLWAGYLGTPISYGCVVLGTYESELLYYWAEVGTPVVIQY